MPRPNAKKLKSSIVAPEGQVLLDADSAQIEARVLAWLAEQDDLVDAFAKGEDVYIKMASKIYGKPEDEIDKAERFVGKTTILGAGYGMGAVKFQAQLKTFGHDMDIDEARRVIQIYRDANWKINNLWRDAQNMLKNLSNGVAVPMGRHGVLEVVADKSAIRLPSGLLMRYDDLQAEQTDKLHYRRADVEDRKTL